MQSCSQAFGIRTWPGPGGHLRPRHGSGGLYLCTESLSLQGEKACLLCRAKGPGPQPSLHGDHSAAAQPCRPLLPRVGPGWAASDPTDSRPCTSGSPAPSPHRCVHRCPFGVWPSLLPCLPRPVLPTSAFQGSLASTLGPHLDGSLFCPCLMLRPWDPFLPGTGGPSQGLSPWAGVL